MPLFQLPAAETSCVGDRPEAGRRKGPNLRIYFSLPCSFYFGEWAMNSLEALEDQMLRDEV